MTTQNFGTLVRAAREAVNLSQHSVAQVLGINRMYYALFEAGRYLIDDEQERALRAYFNSKGLLLENEPRPDRRKAQSNSHDNLESDVPGIELIRAAQSALDAVWSFASSTGVDTKRTAAAVSAAVSALVGLDFQELRRIAESRGTKTAGLPDAAEFDSQNLAKKQLWESRAVGVLICEALYGESWSTAECKKLVEAAASLRQQVSSKDWKVRERDWFESDESYRPDLQCHLAPYLASAAAQRRALGLA